MARRSRTRRPYAGLPRPPAGTYDPSIDATERAAVRGYGDLSRDTRRAGTRAQNDFNIGLEDIGRVRDYGIADLTRTGARTGEDIAQQGGEIAQNYERGFADIGQQRTRATEDHSSALANLQRRYQLLGNSQSQAANAAGLGRGGALQQALRKRTANQALDQQPIDQGFNRQIDDLKTAETRLGENRDQAVAMLDRSRTRAGEDLSTQGFRLTQQYGSGESRYQAGSNPWVDAWMKKNPGQAPPGGPIDTGFEGQRLGLGYQRGAEDRATQVRRGGRELNAYQQDLIPVRYYSAAGLNPYTPRKRRRR